MAANITNTTWTQIASRSSTVLLVPLGSCEQHGPHLALDTDTKIAEYLCAQAALLHQRTMIGPTLSITASGEHSGFAGTLSIGTAVLTQVLIEIVRSAEWCSGVIFVNGHGGNSEAVTTAVRTLTSEQHNVAAWWPRIADGDAHAGMSETSIMLAIDPSRVNMAVAEVGATKPISELETQLRSAGVRAVSTNGILGDPTNANAEHGTMLLSYLAHDLVTFIDKYTNSWVQL